MIKRKMPSKRQVKDYWSDYLVSIGKFDSHRELNEDDYCFACGVATETERAHILARCEGGSDDPSNIHLLCDICHTKSEYISGEEYNEWFVNRKSFGCFLS